MRGHIGRPFRALHPDINRFVAFVGLAFNIYISPASGRCNAGPRNQDCITLNSLTLGQFEHM